MTKVSDLKPSNRPQIIVRIPRDKLGKLNNKWSTYHGRQSSKNSRKKSKKRKKPAEIIVKRFVNTQNSDGSPHLPKLILRLHRNRESMDTSSECETDDESEDDYISSCKVTHYKKKIIQKHSFINRQRNWTLSNEDENALYASTITNENEEVKKDSETTKTDSNNEQENTICPDCTPTSTTQEVNMSEDPKKLAVLDISVISGHLPRLPSSPVTDQTSTDSNISATDQNKYAIGKHILPTVMVPQHQCSRVALPLNDLSSNNIVTPINKLKEEEQKLPSYPNVVAEADSRNEQNINKMKKIDNPYFTTTPVSTNVRRKKSIPVRRKSTVTDECKFQNVETMEDDVAFKNSESKIENLNEKLYTRHNGLELLSMVCTTTAPSTPKRESSADLHKVETVTSTHEQPMQNLTKQHYPGGRYIYDVPDEKRHTQAINQNTIADMKPSIFSPLNTKTLPPKINSSENRDFEKLYYLQKQIQLNNNMQCLRHPPPPYDYVNYPAVHYLNMHRDPNNFRYPPPINVAAQMPQYNLNNIQQTAQNVNEPIQRKSRHPKGATSEQVPRTSQNSQPPSYYHHHQIIPNPSLPKEYFHCYRQHYPIQQDALSNVQPNPNILNSNPTNQQLSPRKINVDTNAHPNLPIVMPQHYHHQNPYLNQFVSPPFDRQASIPPNLYPSVETKQALPVSQQQQNTYTSSDFCEHLNPREPQHWQRQPSNPPVTLVSSQTSHTDQNNTNDFDRNQLVTLYYESQNGAGQNESNGQTIVYAQVPFTKKVSSSDTADTKQVNHRAVGPKQFTISKDTTSFDGLCVPVKISNPSKKAEDSATVGRLFLQCFPDELANIIVDKIKEKSSKELDEKQINSNLNANTSEKLPLSPQKEILQATPSVIIQNSSVTTSSNHNTSICDDKIKNSIDSTSSNDTNALESVNESSDRVINLTSSASIDTTKKVTIQNSNQENISVQNGLSGRNIETQSVIRKNLFDQNKYDNILKQTENIQSSASANQNTESALNLSTSFTSKDTKKKAQEKKIQNRTVEKGVVTNELPFQNSVTKSVVHEKADGEKKSDNKVLNQFVGIKDCGNQNSESVINLPSSISIDSKKEPKQNILQKQIEEKNPSYDRLHYQYSALKSKLPDSLENKYKSDTNVLNFAKNGFGSANECSESAINLTISSASTNNTKKIEEKTGAHAIQEKNFVNNEVLNGDQNLVTKSKILENPVDKTKRDNISNYTENDNNTPRVIVEAKAVKTDSKNTYDMPIENEISTYVKVKKSAEVISKESTDSLLTTNNDDKKIDNNIEESNNECVINKISDNGLSDSDKFTNSKLDDTKEYNESNSNEKVKDDSTKCSPAESKDQNGLESMDLSLKTHDKLNPMIYTSSKSSNCEQKKPDLDSSDDVTSATDDVVIKEENLQSETRESNDFLFDMEFEPNDHIENIFAKIMPSCFMILHLIHEMQTMNNLNWWPVDTSDNLLKIKLSLRGISVFLRKSKKLAVYLDPYIHHIFLFLLECFRTFRERVRLLIETDYSLNENYISTTEADIYRDVFTHLYDYLRCTRITDYVNLITRNDTSLTPKKDSRPINESTVIPRNNVEFSNVHQKHMLIIEKIRQQKVAEEERNVSFKKFVINLDRQLSESITSKDDQDEASTESNKNGQVKSVPTKHGENYPRSTSPDREAKTENDDDNLYKNLKNGNGSPTSVSVISRNNLKRKIELIVIDSDSDEDNQNSGDTCSPKKKLKPIITHVKNRISCIINLDDDGEVSEISETISNKENNKTQLTPDVLESNKRNCPNSLQLNQTSSSSSISNQKVHANEKIQENFKHDHQEKDSINANDSAKNNFAGSNSELNIDDCLTDDKSDISETIKNMMLQDENSNNRRIENIEKESYVNLDSPDIKMEIKDEYEDSLLELNADNNLMSSKSIVEREGEVNPLIEAINEAKNASSDLSNKSSNDRNITETPSKTTVHNVEDSTNSESDETVEAIQNFLREMDANDRNNAQVVQRENTLPNADKRSFSDNYQSETTAEKLTSSANISAFASQTNHNNENKLVGIATPNVKDSDISNKKANQTSVQTIKALSENNHTNIVQHLGKEIEDEIAVYKTNTIDSNNTELLKDLDTEINNERSIIQKLISFRKPFKKISNMLEDSMEHQMSPEQNSEINEKIIQHFSEKISSVEDIPKEVETSKDIESHNTVVKEVNNNIDNTHNQNMNSIASSGKAVNKQISSTEFLSIAQRDKEKTTFTSNVEMRRYSSEGFHRPNVHHQYPIQANYRSKLQDEIPVHAKALKRSASQPHDYSASLKYKGSINNQMDSESNVIDRHANMAITEYFIAHELMSRQRSNPVRPDAIRRLSNDHKNTNPITKTPVVPETTRAQHFQPPNTVTRSDNGKELLRQAIAKKQAANRNLLQHTGIPPADKRKEQSHHKPVSTRIPSLQSIYNESVNTNGFISQYIKDEIGVLSRKESLGPVEYVDEISTLMQLPSIPKDFKDFYVFVTKQQILQFHQPIAFHIFLELLNQSGLKDYHKKFTEYTKRKCEDSVRTKKDNQLRNNTR